LAVFLLALPTGCTASSETVVHAEGRERPRFTRNRSTKPLNEQLATFTTEFDLNDEGRTNNIEKAAESINETILQPGEIFSFNETVGPTIEKHGYMEAIIFVDGEKERGFGGGVCQVSSTLYNAVLEIDLEVTERHPHSRPVFYVEEGKDAATSYGSVDLKFKNTLEFAIKIKAHVVTGEIGKITTEIVRA